MKSEKDNQSVCVRWFTVRACDSPPSNIMNSVSAGVTGTVGMPLAVGTTMEDDADNSAESTISTTEVVSAVGLAGESAS